MDIRTVCGGNASGERTGEAKPIIAFTKLLKIKLALTGRLSNDNYTSR